MATNTEAAELKARRAAQKPSDNPEAKAAVVVGQGEEARREKLLFHPDEPRVLEATGSTYGAFAGEDIPGYTRAAEDAFETFVPDRCTTPVTRLRWSKGQHVPTSVYDKHMAEQKEAASASEKPSA